MAHSFKKLVIVCGIFIAFSLSVLAKSREITIYLHDGSTKTGELLSVRDSVVSVLKNSVENDKDIATHPEMVEIALLKDIDKILLGKYEASGALAGALVGAGIGLISDVALTSGDSKDNMAVGTPLGAMVGALIGWAIAGGNSKDEEILQPVSADDLKNISEYARFDNSKYTTQEPSYVRDIIDNLLKSK